ncbi:DEAD/DEAH box helicase [Frigoribacterium sp. 2355]
MNIAEYLRSSTYAQENLQAIQKQELLATFRAVEPEASVEPVDWEHAFLCASAAALIPEEYCQTYALRVATTALSQPETAVRYGEASMAILEALGNRPAIDLAIRRGYSASQTELQQNALQVLQGRRRRVELKRDLRVGPTEPSVRTVPLSADLNPFQAAFWDATQGATWISASAPTSSGKSWLTRQWIAKALLSSDRTVCVIVLPTRALVEEVSRELLAEVGSMADIHTMPWGIEEISNRPRVFVFTQERLQLLFSMDSDFKPDLLFVDEAQSIEGGSRGILLEQVIHRASVRNPDIQVVFASPMSSNPESLLRDAPSNAVQSIVSTPSVTVTQNLIFVEGVRQKPLRRSVSIVSDRGRSDLGHITLGQRSTSVPLRLAGVAHALAGDSPGNIVYVNSASEAEKVAGLLSQMTGSELVAKGSPLDDLIELVRSTIHPRYALVTALRGRVAFHYGNMPMVVRLEIERLFSSGEIRYLVCTSTLLEGVNLPCRNIFIRNPQKGVGNALSHRDFWNLAGRAGRWGREFAGNIVCIDTDVDDLWANLPTRRTKWPITRAMDHALATPDALERIVSSDSPSTKDTSLAEAAVSYASDLLMRGETLPPSLQGIASQSLRRSIERMVSSVRVPTTVIAGHPGISPRLIDNLFRRLLQERVTASELALPLPEDIEAKNSYGEIFGRLADEVTTAFGGEKRQQQLANLVVNWMKGIPLSRLITYRIKAYPSKSLSANIREVMSDIENVCRFQAPRYLGLYGDTVTAVANSRGEEIPEGLSDIVMMLEMGVSRRTDLSIASLGISRSSTVALGALIANDSFSVPQLLEWLRERNLQDLDLPALVRSEISQKLRPSL